VRWTAFALNLKFFLFGFFFDEFDLSGAVGALGGWVAVFSILGGEKIVIFCFR